MPLELRMYEDVFSSDETVADQAGVANALFVAAGQVTVGIAAIDRDDGIVVTEPRTLKAGPDGACLWRWEVVDALDEVRVLASRSRLLLSEALSAVPGLEGQLLRLDSVAFPPGGCAYLHTHQGPGIRCIIEGAIRIDSEGHSASYGPGSPWFEAGPEPVFAQADQVVPTRFIRVSVLPGALAGKSSIRYVNEEDQAKPKSQTYRVFSEKMLG